MIPNPEPRAPNPDPRVHFRFYEELNDFLPAERRKLEFSVPYYRASVKDMIESLGVPHTEVDLILVNGESVDFTCLVHAGDRVSVYPEFESFDISGLARLRPDPLRQPRFVLDAHLGKLARSLRLLGFDTLYSNVYTDAELEEISAAGKRTLLTRDRGLLKRSRVSRGYFVRATAPQAQVREVLRRFDLYRSGAPFSRCLRCNGALQPAEREEVRHRVPSGVVEAFDTFSVCPDCGRVYWPGSHYERLRRLADQLLARGEV